MRADAAALAVLNGQAAVVEENLPLCLGDDAGPDPLHDLRVAVRRSRSVLRQLWRVFPRGQRRAQARSLGWIQDATGPARDLDVQLLGWEDLIADLPPTARAALAPPHDLLVASRADAFAVMREKLGSQKFDRRWSAWRSFVAGELEGARAGPHAARTIDDVVGRRVRSIHQQVVSDGSGIDQSSPAEALHDLRKRGKELRYLLELFGDIWPAEAIGPVVGTLKSLQDALGDHQDLEVQTATLRSLQAGLRKGATPGDGESATEDTLRALDLVIGHLRWDQSDARARCLAGFAAFAATDLPAAIAS